MLMFSHVFIIDPVIQFLDEKIDDLYLGHIQRF